MNFFKRQPGSGLIVSELRFSLIGRSICGRSICGYLTAASLALLLCLCVQPVLAGTTELSSPASGVPAMVRQQINSTGSGATSGAPALVQPGAAPGQGGSVGAPPLPAAVGGATPVLLPYQSGGKERAQVLPLKPEIKSGGAAGADVKAGENSLTNSRPEAGSSDRSSVNQGNSVDSFFALPKRSIQAEQAASGQSGAPVLQNMSQIDVAKNRASGHGFAWHLLDNLGVPMPGLSKLGREDCVAPELLPADQLSARAPKAGRAKKRVEVESDENTASSGAADVGRFASQKPVSRVAPSDSGARVPQTQPSFHRLPATELDGTEESTVGDEQTEKR